MKQVFIIYIRLKVLVPAHWLSFIFPENLLTMPVKGKLYTVEIQWLEHLSDRENMFETGVVRASECLT